MNIVEQTLDKMKELEEGGLKEGLPRTTAYIDVLPDSPVALYEIAKENYGKREALVHSDVHGFNVLVEVRVTS